MLVYVIALFLLISKQPGDSGPWEHGPYEHNITVLVSNYSINSAKPSVLPKVLLWSSGDGRAGVCEFTGGGGGMSLSWPVQGRNIRDNRLFLGKGNHRGVDIDADIGTPVLAASSGTVVYAGWNSSGLGNLVCLHHGGNYVTCYAHLSQINVSCGEGVSRSRVIGATGQTGLASWPHLHFEVRLKDEAVFDPLQWLSGYNIIPAGTGIAPPAPKLSLEEIMEKIKK